MKKLGVTGILMALLAVGACIIGGVFIYAVSFNNDLVRQENGIKAVHQDMQNVHSSVAKQLKGQGLTAEKYGNMVIEALRVGVEGRYGQTGSQAAFQWIQEQNPTIDPEIMTKLQQAIEVGYNKFEAAQRGKIDRLRIYEDTIGVFPGSLVASVLGFPKIDMEVYGRIIVTGDTQETFETGIETAPDIFSE